MAFPCNLNPRRGRMAAARAGHFSALVEFLAFLKAKDSAPPFRLEDMTYSMTFGVPDGSVEERKAFADNLARELGAATEWRNGYYMATCRYGQLRSEILFTPLIQAADADGGEGRGSEVPG